MRLYAGALLGISSENIQSVAFYGIAHSEREATEKAMRACETYYPQHPYHRVALTEVLLDMPIVLGSGSYTLTMEWKEGTA